MDSSKLEEEIERINETLMRVYSRPAACCKRVKTAILSRASAKQDTSHLELTYKEVQEIGKELIHENLYDYITYLNRKTFNDVIFRLMSKRVLKSPFFNVPQQKHRKVYTHFLGVDYNELLLVEAIDKELRAFHLGDAKTDTPLSDEDEIICRIIASFAIHSAMVFEGFHKQLLMMKYQNIDLRNNFLTVNLHDLDTPEEEDSAFFRYFISSITMVYLLLLVSVFKKNKILKTPLRNNGGRNFFGDRRKGKESLHINAVFKEWIGRIARKYGLEADMDVERFRFVCIRYLTVKYPIFLLSVHTRSLLSDSLDMDYFSPLLNIEHRKSSKKARPIETSEQRSDKVLKELLGNDKELYGAVKEIMALRGRIKDTPSRKRVSEQIKAEIKKLTRAKQQEFGVLPPVLSNYIIYWEWLLFLIDSTKLSGGSLGTYTGSIGRHFVPLLSEKSILDSETEYVDAKVLNFIGQYESRDNVKNLKRFFSFIKLKYDKTDLPNLLQKKFLKAIRSYPKPLLYFRDIKRALAGVPNVNLRFMIMLGFYAGLRAGEFASLRMSNLIYDGGYVLCVRKSKTKNGVRNIPLYLLMPDKYLRELVEYWKKEMNTRKPRDYFFTNNGKMLNSKKMATLVAGFFLDSLGISMRNHYLRHSFASWFLIRWFAATYGKNFFDPACSFLKEDLFDEEYLKRIRHLLYGFRILQRGQENFSHIFAALARLVGHGSPRITIKNYIHVIDFLTHLYFRKKYNNPQVKMTSKKLAVLLNVSHATLPLEFRGKSLKVIRVEDIVKFQKERLRLSNN